MGGRAGLSWELTTYLLDVLQIDSSTENWVAPTCHRLPSQYYWSYWLNWTNDPCGALYGNDYWTEIHWLHLKFPLRTRDRLIALHKEISTSAYIYKSKICVMVCLWLHSSLPNCSRTYLKELNNFHNEITHSGEKPRSCNHSIGLEWCSILSVVNIRVDSR